ncbi:MAG: hypothetical protein Q8L60_12405 [Gammaproteobacteria bacterium]|nr:hypothetical protein [Gammaproteobacteria bacterium]MDP2141566.1 hypothetical protein [Gammaproteobacteria bacterium]MDP2346678.1 hypothetical protein [Gammaproteobacteria bacterium]
MRSNKFLSVLLVCVFMMTMSEKTLANATPGVAVSDSVMSQSAITLVSLAEQIYPDLFSGATSWRSFEGFYYKYYATTGVYVGINGSDLYLMGGPFGGDVTYQGSVADALIVLGGSSGSPTEPFKNIASTSNLADLIRYFRKIKLEYATGGFATTKVAVALEVLGQEAISGETTDKLMVTVTGGSLTSPSIAEMWVNSKGEVVKFSQSGMVWTMPHSNTFGIGLVSGMLLALAAVEQPIVKAAIANELKDNQAVAQKLENRVINGIPVKTLTIQISAGSSSITTELSEFGTFSMATKMVSNLGFSTTSFEMMDLELR